MRLLAGFYPSQYLPVISNPPIGVYRVYGFDSADASKSVVAYWTGGWSSDNGVWQPVRITFHHPSAHHVRVYDPISNTSVGAQWVQSGTDVVVSGPKLSIGSVPQYITID
jgi:hypothetical protein